ncbi:ComEC/Rec2 family competence protein [Brooklawnia cerclae]|uniref:Competence protein ComEC n=1 Tax=Brooklawnia cerclae TaxID=349934 RepID=A0ABX0SK04_9ACTN|nr:competence protein ComEC [Brooklawnia cerclae]
MTDAVPEDPVDLRLVLPALGAWAGAASGVTPGRAAVVLAIAGATLVVAGWTRRAWVAAATGAAVAGSIVVAWLWATGLAASTPAGLARDGALVEVRAVVSSDVRTWEASGTRPGLALLPVTVQWIEARGDAWQGRVPATVRSTGGDAARDLAFPVGATIEFQALAAPADPGDRSIGTLALRGDVAQLESPQGLAALANRFREGLRTAMGHSPSEQAGLVPSLVVGDTSAVPSEVTDDFTTTGLTHLTAVSGTNLTLMLGFCLALARGAGVRGWWLRGIGVLVTVVFVVVCRAEPSVLRAAAMGLVALAATGLARDRRRGLRNLCVAVLGLVLVDPWLARSWGFALSVTASAGILWWGGPWQARMRRWAPGWVAEALAIPLSAQIATQPIVTVLSGSVSVVGLPANMLVGPFVGPVTVIGLAAAVVSLVSPPVAGVLGWAAGWCVQPILLVAHAGAAAPAATWRWAVSPTGIAVLALLCVVVAVGVVPRVLDSRWGSALLVMVVLVGALRSPPQAGWPDDWAVIACDVGQGGAQLFRAGRHSAVIVDTGPDPGLLADCLRLAGVDDVPLLVLTHPHADHVGGVSALGDDSGIGVGMVLIGPASWQDAGARLLGHLPAPHVTHAGDVVRAGQVTWTTLAAGGAWSDPISAGDGDSAAENDAGVVGRVDVDGITALATGDIEVAGQQALVASGVDLHADVLVVPHHGSPNQDERFVEAVGASVALVQVGEDNDYGHPAGSTLALVGARGAAVFRTDLQGAIAIRTDPLEVVTQR